LGVTARDVVIMGVQVSTNESVIQLAPRLRESEAHVKTSHPPFPLPALSTGNLRPTAPLFPIPPYHNPSLAPNVFPTLLLMVDSLPNNQSATPQCDSREMRKYRSGSLSGETDLAWDESKDSIRSVRA